PILRTDDVQRNIRRKDATAPHVPHPRRDRIKWRERAAARAGQSGQMRTRKWRIARPSPVEDRRPRLSGQAGRLPSTEIIGKTESCSQWFFAALMLAALSTSAQSVALTPRGVVVAHDGV